MNLKKILILSVILIALGIYINKYEIPTEERKLKEEFFLNGVKNSEITQVEVKRKDDAWKIVSTDEGGKKIWKLESLPTAKIDDFVINGLLSSLTGLKLIEGINLDPSEDLSNYGLKEPEIEVSAKTSQGDNKLQVGKKSDYLAKRYLKKPEKPALYLTADAIYEALNKSGNDLRSKSPVAFDNTDIKEFALNNKNGLMRVAVLSTDAWTIQEPVYATGSLPKLQELARELKNIKIKEFIDPPKTDEYNRYFSQPDVKFTFGWKDEEKSPLEIMITEVKEGDQVMQTLARVSGSDTVFSIEPVKIEIFNQFVPQLREKKLMQFNSWLADELIVNKPGVEEIKLTKKQDKWYLGDKEVDVEKVAVYMKDVSDIEARVFVPSDKVAKPQQGHSLVIVAALSDKKKVIFTVYDQSDIPGTNKEFPYLVFVEGKNEPFYIGKEEYEKMILTVGKIEKTAATPAPLSSVTPAEGK